MMNLVENNYRRDSHEEPDVFFAIRPGANPTFVRAALEKQELVKGDLYASTVPISPTGDGTIYTCIAAHADFNGDAPEEILKDLKRFLEGELPGRIWHLYYHPTANSFCEI